jgi:hypothetical protein
MIGYHREQEVYKSEFCVWITCETEIQEMETSEIKQNEQVPYQSSDQRILSPILRLWVL